MAEVASGCMSAVPTIVRTMFVLLLFNTNTNINTTNTNTS